jgi:hypothetical protein
LGAGFQVVARPVEVFIAAALLLLCPPMVVNVPPTYAREPLIMMLNTVLFASGFHDVANPVDILKAAILFRLCPPIEV